MLSLNQNTVLLTHFTFGYTCALLIERTIIIIHLIVATDFNKQSVTANDDEQKDIYITPVTSVTCIHCIQLYKQK